MKNTNTDPEPTQPAALIILVSTIGYALLAKLLFPALGVPALVNLGIWLCWVLLTAAYLVKTNNARIARIYMMVMFGMMLFIWLAIYYNRGG